MPGEPKRHHYVPRFYLEEFASKQEGSRTGAFWVYDKQGGEPRLQTPKNTAVQSRFYDLSHEGEQVPVEQMLAEIESDAKPVLQRWGRGETSRKDIPLLARFLADMYVRVPRQIATTEETGTALAREMVKADRPHR
jgi:hypothetical protein